MADAVTQPIVDAASQVVSPVATMGFGAREAADAWRMSQQSLADDEPLDVNMQQVIVRSQALTVDMAGKSFEANNDVRQKLQDRLMLKPVT